MRKMLVILGIPVDDLDMEETLDRLDEFVVIGRESGKGHQIATINADFAVKAQYDPELRYLLQEADMATADGMPLVWGARLMGVPMAERVAGADLIPALAKRAADKGYSLYLLGSAPGVASRAGMILQEKNPGLKIVGISSPPYSSVLEMDRKFITDIKEAKPDILLVAFGNPKQEKWIGMYGRELSVPVMIGVGGTLDFIAGNTRRAPMWMQRYGLEWLYRLMREPRRLWRRYVVDLVVFGSFFVRLWWVMRRRQEPAVLVPKSDVVIIDDTAVLSIRGRMDFSNHAAFVEDAQKAMEETPYLIVDLNETTYLDSAAIGALVGLTKQARDFGGKIWLVAVPDPIYQIFSLMRLDHFFDIREDVNVGLAARLERNYSPSLTVQVYGEWTVVRMPRRLDAITCPEVTPECINMLESSPYLVLDMSDTVFLASAGLATIVQLNRKAEEEGGEVRLSGCSKDVISVLRMARFDQVFSLYDNVSTATTKR